MAVTCLIRTEFARQEALARGGVERLAHECEGPNGTGLDLRTTASQY